MSPIEKDLSAPMTWKSFLLIALKFLIVFYVSTFLLVVLFAYRGQHWIIPGIFIGLLYLLIIIFSLVKMIRQLPMAAIMLAAPTLPLMMLILVISLIPLLNFFNLL